MNRLRPFPIVEQFDETDCGAACLSMVCKYYKKSVPMTRIREAAGTDRLGTNIEGMLKAAEKLGFWAKGLAGSPDQFNKDTPVPFIAHMRLEDRLHYVVVYKVGSQKILAADPASGRVRYSREVFTDLWSGIFIALIPSVTFRKGNEGSDSPLWRFMPVLRPHVGVLVEVFFASLLLLFLSLATFFYFRFLVDQVVPGGLTTALHAVSIAMLGIAIFRGGLEALRRLSLAHIGNRIDLSIVFAYFRHVLGLPMSFFDRRRVGEIMTRLDDISEIRSVLSGVSLSMVVDVVMVLGVGIFLLSQSVTLTAVALAPVPIAVTIVLLMVRPFERNNREYMVLDAESQSHITEVMTGMFTIKSMNSEARAFTRGEERLIEVIRQDYRLEKLSVA